MTVDAKVAALREEYQAKIGATEDAAEQNTLELEMHRAINGAYEEGARDRQVADWKAAALQQFPRALPSVITGSTEAEIQESAKAIHEHVEASMKEDEAKVAARLEAEAKQRLYGGGNRGGGGPSGDGGEPVTADLPFDTLRKKVQGGLAAAGMVPTESRLREGWEGGAPTAPLTEQDRDKFVQGVGDMLIQRQIHGVLPDGREEKK